MSEEKIKYNTGKSTTVDLTMTKREKFTKRIDGLIDNSPNSTVTVTFVVQDKELVSWFVKDIKKMEA